MGSAVELIQMTVHFGYSTKYLIQITIHVKQNEIFISPNYCRFHARCTGLKYVTVDVTVAKYSKHKNINAISFSWPGWFIIKERRSIARRSLKTTVLGHSIQNAPCTSCTKPKHVDTHILKLILSDSKAQIHATNSKVEMGTIQVHSCVKTGKECLYYPTLLP